MLSSEHCQNMCVLHALLHLNPYREGTQAVLKHHYLYVRNALGEDVYKTGNWRLLEAVLSAAIWRLVAVIYSDNNFDHKNVAFYLNKYVWSLFKITWPWLKNETIKKNVCNWRSFTDHLGHSVLREVVLQTINTQFSFLHDNPIIWFNVPGLDLSTVF